MRGSVGNAARPVLIMKFEDDVVFLIVLLLRLVEED